MKNPINFMPVKFNDHFEIVDAKGNVVVPSITWKADWSHQRHQALVGVFLEQLINIYGGELTDFGKENLTEKETSLKIK